MTRHAELLLEDHRRYGDRPSDGGGKRQLQRELPVPASIGRAAVPAGSQVHLRVQLTTSNTLPLIKPRFKFYKWRYGAEAGVCAARAVPASAHGWLPELNRPLEAH